MLCCSQASSPSLQHVLHQLVEENLHRLCRRSHLQGTCNELQAEAGNSRVKQHQAAAGSQAVPAVPAACVDTTCDGRGLLEAKVSQRQHTHLTTRWSYATVFDMVPPCAGVLLNRTPADAGIQSSGLLA